MCLEAAIFWIVRATNYEHRFKQLQVIEEIQHFLRHTFYTTTTFGFHVYRPTLPGGITYQSANETVVNRIL